MKLLLSRGAKYDLAEDSLHSLVKSGDIEAVAKLLDEGTNINEVSLVYNSRKKSFPSRTALQIAMRSGDKEMLSLLLSRGAEIELQDGQLDKISALEFALKSSDFRLSLEICARGFSKSLQQDMHDKGYEFLPGTDISLKPGLTVADFKKLASTKESSGAAAAASSAASDEAVISLEDLLELVFKFNNDKALSAFLDLSGAGGLEKLLQSDSEGRNILHRTTNGDIVKAIAACLIEDESKILILDSLLAKDSSGKSAIIYLQKRGILEVISLIFGI